MAVHPVRIERTPVGYRVHGRGVDAKVKTFSQAWELSRFILGPYWHF